MPKSHRLFFILILILAFITRFWNLGKLPPSLNWDEVSHGYNAYSLLQTGKDQWGVPFPLTNFRAYGDYPTTLNLYLTIPFIKILGLTPLSIRLPSAIVNFLFVIVIYYLGLLLFTKKHISLLVMLLATISPWSLFTSHGVFQSNFSLLFFSLGLYFFLLSVTRFHSRFPLFSSLFFSLSLYSYHNARIATPLTLVFLFIYFRRQIISHYKIYLFSFAFALLAFIPIALNLATSEIAARNRWVGIINPNSVNQIIQNRQSFTGPYWLNRLFHNRPTYFATTLTSNLLNLLNPLPLFFTGTQNYQFNIPHTPLIFTCFLPFLYLGILSIFYKKNRSLIYLFLLFIICLVPAALTTGDFPSVRASLALPFYFIFIAIGLDSIFNRLPRLFFYLIIFISLIGFISYTHQYLNSYLTNYSSTWQYGYQDMVGYVKSVYPQYTHIYITKKYGEPHEFLLFYWPWDPRRYLTDGNLHWDFHSDWYWVNSFDKFTFLNDWDILLYSFPPNSLLISSPHNTPPDFKLQQQILSPNSDSIFEISENL